MPATLRALLRLPALALGAALALAACGRQAPAEEAQAAGGGPADLFLNGDFETGDLSDWDPVVTNLNGTLSAVPPTTVAQLNLQAGGANLTRVISGANGSVVPALLSAGGSTLRVPRYGSHVAVVNEYSSNVYGHGQNVNTLQQTMRVTNADVDPADGKVHVRFAIAPVLENPSHSNAQQPYFWVQLWNNTKGAQLFYTFNFSNQAGVPWKTDASTGVLYTDWKSFDISPGPAALAIGDLVELKVVAAGCSLGGHDGHVYVDSFGPILPGLSVTATAPQSVNRGSTLTYTLTYKNAGPGGADGVVITQVLPANTTFSSVSAPGATCTTPSVGSAGTVTCTLGSLTEATTGSLTITVNVSASATVGSSISNGNYQIAGTDIAPLIGPLVQTTVTSGVTYAGLSVTASDGHAAVGWGSAVTYTITVANAGPGAANGATIADPLPAQLTAATWDCSGSGGAACTAASGSGAISQTIPTLPAGGSVSYHLYASVVSGTGSGSVANQVTVGTPSGVSDPDSTNNVAVDTDAIGTLRTLTVAKAGSGSGTVVSVPAAISCGATCSAAFLEGTGVVLTATAAPGSLFTGWTGACTGTSSTCTTTVSADSTATATFIVPRTITTSVPGGHGTLVCPSPVDNGSVATCTFTPDPDYTLSALTDGGVDVLGSASGGTYVSSPVTSDRTVTATFSPTVSSVALTFLPSSPVFGDTLTLTATVAGVAPSGVPTGTVTFHADGATISGCSGVPLVVGIATCSGVPSAGTFTLTATYGGDATWNGATSPPVELVVSPAATLTTVGSSLDPSSYGAPVTFTVSVSTASPGPGVPAGQVELRVDGAVLATLSLDVGGQATLTTSGLGVGVHPIAAAYLGSSNHEPSTSAELSQIVVKAIASVALAASADPSAWSQPVTLTATVSSAGGTPSGSVAFYADGALLGTAAVQLDGTAALVTSALPVGTSSVVASYQGSGSFEPASSSSLPHTVNQAQSTTALAVTASPTVVGQAVTLTATVAVAGPATGTPTGTVTFLDGSVVVGTGILQADGTATLTLTTLAPGEHALTATYGGSTSVASSTTSSPIAHVVDPAATSVALGSSLNPSLVGQAVTFTATVASVAPGAGTPTGTVAFRADGTDLPGCSAVALSAGSASCTTTSLASGSHAVTAAYGGSEGYQAGSASLTQTVDLAATTTTLAATPTPSVVGQSVTLTATVAASASCVGTPSGTVTFRDGTTVLGSGELSGAGVASLSISTLALGDHALAAEYGATSAFLGSSGTTSLTVGPAATTTVLAAAPSPARLGQAVGLTATVAASAPGAGVPGGTITFRDGTTVLGTVDLDGSGVAALSGVTSLVLGDHSLSASYGGNPSYLASEGATTLAVQQGTTTVAVTSSLNPSRFGRPVTFTAAVASQGGTPTGTLTFVSGETELGTGELDASGTATLTLRDLKKGTHPVTARYAGSETFAEGSGELSGGQVVENSPPVAGAGDALALGTGQAASAAADGAGELELVRTVELWARTGWTSPGEVSGVPLLLRVGDDSTPRYSLGVAPDRASLQVQYGAATETVAAPLSDGAWHHLALVSDAGNVTVVVDGATAGVLAGSFDDSAGDQVLLGDGFPGAIDEVRLWTTARTPADLAADARRPVARDASGLAALWRMDDHLGTTTFDAGPGGLDLVATLQDAPVGTDPAFAPSGAWRSRTATSGQPMAPVDAGYDADGDPLTLAVTAPPAHGTASVDGGGLQVSYRSDAEYGGADALTFQLDDGEARSSYAIEIAVTGSLACTVDADCAGGNLCVAGACTAPGDVVARSGGGCSSGGGGALLSGLLGLLLAGLLGRRRAPAPAGVAHGRGRSRRALLVLGLLLFAGPARAQTPSGFALQTYEPAPAGDRFFVVPGTAVEGNLQPAAGLVLSWAKDPLVLKRDGREIPGGKIVKSQTWGWAVGSLTVLDRVLLDVSVPVALAQSGDKPFSSFPRVTSSAMGDLRLGARTPLPTLGPVSLAAALGLWLPTGKRQAFSSDQSVRALPQLIAGARLGSGELGAQLGLLVRRNEDVTLTRTGAALAFSAGAAWPLGPVRVGPEVYGRWQFQGTATSPVEALLGARYGIGDVDLGLAAGTAFDDSPGAAPLRVIGQVMWRPRAAPLPPPPATPVEAPRPPPDRDGDGIPDALDACPDQPGPAADDSASNGCPPPPPPAPAAAVEPPAPQPAAPPPPPPPPPDRDGDGIPDTLDACPDQPGPENGDPSRNGCQGLATVAEGRIEVFQQIKFETDRDVIQPVSLPVLEEVARILAAHPEITRMRIEGYTDSRGSAVHNTDLSDRRAKAVRRWLVGKGIAPGRLEAKGYGPARPVADNASEVGRAANRRVEFRIE